MTSESATLRVMGAAPAKTAITYLRVSTADQATRGGQTQRTAGKRPHVAW